MIRFEHVNKRYGDSLILNDLSFEIKTGELTVLIGPSGCGKTTTLKTINRLIEPDEGRVFINGEDTSKTDKVTLRRSIGYVIQQIGLFPNMTVEQNICVVPKLLKYDKDKCNKIVHDMLELVNMPYDEYAHKYPVELSGGQQQRIGVLRALAASPPIVLMDEPFGALDPMTRTVLQEEVTRIQRKFKKTIVFVTHDMDEALNMADKIIFMDKGDILQMATPEEMLSNPADDLIRSFMGKRSTDMEAVPQTAADFMYTKVYTSSKNRGVREAVDLMARRNIDTLLVKNDDDTYAGTVSIKTIRNQGKAGTTIEALISRSYEVSYVDEDAQECFEKLLNSDGSYVVVLNHDDTVAGIVTKTSIAKALADAVWGKTMGNFFSLYGDRLVTAIWTHFLYVIVSVAIALVIALIFGALLSRRPGWATVILPFISVFQTIPGIVFIGVLFLILGIKPVTVIIALSIYAIFPILKNTYVGLVEVQEQYKEAARGCGMSSIQILFRVEFPLALPSIMSGLRMSTVYTVSWAVLAAMIGLGGLGDFIYSGVSSNNNTLIIAGAIPAAIMAVGFSWLIDGVRKLLIPKQIRRDVK